MGSDARREAWAAHVAVVYTVRTPPPGGWEGAMMDDQEGTMIHAYVLIEAEPTRVQELVEELRGMELEGSVIKQVHAVTGHYDLIAYVESPDLQSLGN